MVIAELFATLGLIPDKESFAAGHHLIENLAHGFEAYLSIEAMKGVVEMFQGIAEAADHAAKESMRTGIAVQALQELGHAAESSDSSLQSLESGLSKLEKGMEKAAKTGKGPVVDALRKLHLTLGSFAGMSAEEKFTKISDAISKMPDSLEKTTIATQLLGGAGRSLIPLLNAGPEGIAEMRHEAHELGLVVDEQTAKAFGDFNDQVGRLQKSFQGIRVQVAEALLPVFKDLVDRAYEWVRANREWIEAGIEGVVEGVIAVFKTLVKAVEVAVDFLFKHKEILVGALALIAGWLGLIALQAIATGLAILISFAPVIAAIAVVGFGLKAMWDAFGGGEYTATEVMHAVQNLLEDFSHWLQDLPNRIGDWMKEAGDAIVDAFGAAWDAVVAGAKAAWKAITDTIHEAWEAIKDIPIVGHVIRGGAFVVRGLRDSGSFEDMYNSAQNDSLTKPLVSVPSTSSISAPVINGGDVHITVNGSNLSPEELRAAIEGHVREVQTDALRQTMNNLGGGKRT